jgi:hypothetical protein
MGTPEAAAVARAHAILDELDHHITRDGEWETRWQADDLLARALQSFADAREAVTWEAAATMADDIARLYAEQDESPTWDPTGETCAAVACAVNIAAEIRARAAARRAWKENKNAKA